MNVAYFGQMGMQTFGITASDWSNSPSSTNVAGDGYNWQFRALALDTANVGNVLMASVLGQQIIGVLLNAPKANESCEICVLGETKLLAGGTITTGALLTVDANARFVVAASGQTVVGIARMPAVVGDYFTGLISAFPGVLQQDV